VIVRDVVKVGGSLARDAGRLRRVMGALAALEPRPLVVPGGGALADAVRALHARGGPSEETAHRMALLALDAMALWMAELGDGAAAPGGSACVVREADGVRAALTAGRLPVLAPSGWLESESALPASWRVTSDSIAAWAAGRLGARRLVLVKAFTWAAPEVALEELGDVVDETFSGAWSDAVECRLVEGEPDAVRAALCGAGGTVVRRARPVPAR
jgi:dihydroneopterin aldolase